MARDDGARYRQRLQELKLENQLLIVRRDELDRLRTDTATDEQLVARLMAGNGTTTVIDREADLQAIAEQLAANQRAQTALSKALGVIELADGYKRALPLFERAMGHAGPLATALGEVERILSAADADLRLFEETANDVVGRAAQHPVAPPYDEGNLRVLRFWMADFLGDRTGLNESRLDHWRDLCIEVGLV